MSTRGFSGLFALAMLLTVFGGLSSAAASAGYPVTVSAAPATSSPAPATASGDLGWTSPTILVPQTPTNTNLGGVALAGDKTGMVVWEKDGLWATIMATRWVPGAGDGGSNWQAPVNLSSPGCNEYAPQVAMNATGYAIAVWLDTCNYGIRESVFHPGVGWSTTTEIDQYGSASYNPQIAMNAAGVAFVTWVNWDGSAHHVYANRYVPGTGWGTPTRVDPTANDSAAPYVGVDAQGNAIIAWYRNDGGTDHVYASRFSAGAWSATPLRLPSSSNSSYYPSISVDSIGNAVVAWIEHDSLYRIWANRFDNATATWSGAVPIESQPEWAVPWEGPKVSANNGSAVVTWVMYGPGSEPYSVFANRYESGVGWGTEADVDLIYGTTYYADVPSVALDSHGNATIVFHELEIVPTGPYPTWTVAIRYSALTGAILFWQQIDNSRLSPGAPLLAMDSTGDALSVWNYNEGTTENPVNGILANYFRFGSGSWCCVQQAEWDENVKPYWLQLESNSAGDAIFSWTQWNGLVEDGYAALYTPTNGWGTPTKIESFEAGVSEEWSAMDGQGNAIVLFKASDGTQYNVYASYYSVQTGWGSPRRLDTATGSGKYWLRISMNRNGEGLAVWNEFNGVQWNAYSDFFNGTTQRWGSPVVIQSQFDYVGTVVGALDGSGNAMAAFWAYNGSGYSNYASYYRPGTGWGAPVHISVLSSSVGQPYAMAANDQGDFAVSWGEWDGSRDSAVASVFTPQGGWGPETYLANGPGNSGPAIPSLDGAGDALVAYWLWDGMHYDDYAVTKPAGGAWGTPTLLGVSDTTQVTSALDYRGNGFVAWTQYNGYGYDIVARRYLASQGWLPASVINSPAPAMPATDTGSPILAVDGHGNGMLGWNEWHQGVLVPYASEYIVGSGAPSLVVNSPADGLLTNKATVTVSGTTDPGASVAIDGKAVAVAPDGSFSGASTLPDGPHTFTIVATNAAGLTETTTRSVTVDTTVPAITLTSPANGLLTRSPVVQVTGTTEAGATVVVNGVDAAVSTSGQFSVAISLHEGPNTIAATATDPAGNQANASVGVTLDTVPPAITITSPRSGANESSPAVTVTGMTEPGATVVVNGQSVSVDASGAFSVQLTLSEGANLITATSTDAAGNSASAMVVVTYTNPAPAAQVQATLGSLNMMDLVLIVLVVVSLALGVLEMFQIRKLRGRGSERAPPKSESAEPPNEEH